MYKFFLPINLTLLSRTLTHRALYNENELTNAEITKCSFTMNVLYMLQNKLLLKANYPFNTAGCVGPELHLAIYRTKGSNQLQLGAHV